MESEVGWSGSILIFGMERFLLELFGWRDGAALFIVWLEGWDDRIFRSVSLRLWGLLAGHLPPRAPDHAAVARALHPGSAGLLRRPPARHGSCRSAGERADGGARGGGPPTVPARGPS